MEVLNYLRRGGDLRKILFVKTVSQYDRGMSTYCMIVIVGSIMCWYFRSDKLFY
jgi:hypothetical protein